MTGRLWLASRVGLALLLMVSFYALAIGLSTILVWLVFAELKHLSHVNLKLPLVLLGAAATILWSIVPRPDKFVPPGPRVEPSQEPALFSAIRDVAGATGQAMPADVYLVNNVNAFVAQRGGLMGVGSHRVMGLGLPLMQAVTVQEFKGILAHEFGHYHAGDVALGPWIYKTRGAIGRTIEQLSGNLLQAIFVWYGNVFLRITHAVSRRQEFIADEVAARAAGASAMASGLRRVHAAAVAFDHYWRGEVAHVLDSGYLPPLSQGFARFMQHATVASNMAAVVEHEEHGGQTDPYDTHPALRDRLAALSTLEPGAAGDARPATVLLSDVGRWERQILAATVGDHWASGLKAMPWEKVVESVYVPLWRKRVQQHRRLFAPFTIATVPTSRLDLAPLGDAFLGLDRDEAAAVPADIRVSHGVQLLTSAIALALVDVGWTASASIGDEIVLTRDGRDLRPFSELLAIATGTSQSAAERTPVTADWRSRCAELGISDVRLVSDSVEAASVPRV